MCDMTRADGHVLRLTPGHCVLYGMAGGGTCVVPGDTQNLRDVQHLYLGLAPATAAEHDSFLHVNQAQPQQTTHWDPG